MMLTMYKSVYIVFRCSFCFQCNSINLYVCVVTFSGSETRSVDIISSVRHVRFSTCSDMIQ